MDNLKIKVIGVLREREEAVNVNNNQRKVNGGTEAAANGIGGDGGSGGIDSGGGGGGAAGDSGTNERTANNVNIVRQLPKMSALDLAGILNCRRRLEWTKEWLKKNRTEFLSKENLLKDIQFRNNETYHLNCFFDITERQFRYLVSKLSPVISSYEPHRKKKPFSAEERIAITLKYLATGEVHSCRNYCFRASKPVILKMIANICLSMHELLKDQFISLPKTDEQWQNVANEFHRKNHLPNCLGSMTMHQIDFYTSSRTEENPNFKTKPPLIFTAIVDSNDNFMYVNVEKSQAPTSSEIYEHSTIKQLIENKTLLLPSSVDVGDGNSDAFNADDDEQKQRLDISNDYYFAGHRELPVKSYLFNSSYIWSNFNSPEMEFGYAMDMASMHADSALRILSNIFPIFAMPLRIDEENASKITLGVVALYNFLRKTDRNFCEQTDKINVRANGEDEEDCILISDNEEEIREREEFTPTIAISNCFHRFSHKQKGDTASGLAKRELLMKHIADTKLIP